MTVVAYGAATDVGRLRRVNEDSVLAEPPVFLVADGMGGHIGGGAASDMVVRAFSRLVGSSCPARAVSDALSEGNERILDEVQRHPAKEGMGTTVAGLVLIDDSGQERWLAFNVGDSRIYRLAGGELLRVSTDHSLVQELVDAGDITPEQARRHPQRNIVTRALGTDPPPPTDYWLLAPLAGERFLLCSDGLTGEVLEEQIRTILLDDRDPADAADRLVAAALAAGGHDNVSVVVIDTIAAECDDQDTVQEESTKDNPGKERPAPEPAPPDEEPDPAEAGGSAAGVDAGRPAAPSTAASAADLHALEAAAHQQVQDAVRAAPGVPARGSVDAVPVLEVPWGAPARPSVAPATARLIDAVPVSGAGQAAVPSETADEG